MHSHGGHACSSCPAAHGQQQQQQSQQEQQQAVDEDVLEQQALGKIVFAFRQYAQCTEQEIARWEHNYRALSARHRVLLHHLPAKAAAARAAVRQNQLFISALLEDFAEGAAGTQQQQAQQQQPLAKQQQQQQQQQQEQQQHDKQQQQQQEEQQQLGEEGDAGGGMPDALAAGAVAHANELQASGQQCGPAEAEKVRYVLKNLVRDWSAEGALERQQSFGRIVDKLKECFSDWSGPSPPRVLLPGAGLGRLCVEVAAAGFEAQGNEFSYFMLLTAAFMLNSSAVAEQWTVHPWVHITANNVADADQLRGVAVPDAVPGELVPPGMLSMCAGDFTEVYARPEMASSFDAVVTCFFIDTAHNVLEYLEVIHAVLKPGGVWIHLGPLLWHWADGSWSELSVELSLADVRQAALLMGFTLLHQEFVDAAYIANIRSMYKTLYQAAFWTMRKTEAQLPDLNELVRLLAVSKQQQQQQEGPAG